MSTNAVGSSSQHRPETYRQRERAHPKERMDGRVDGGRPGVREEVVIGVCETGILDEVFEVTV